MNSAVALRSRYRCLPASPLRAALLAVLLQLPALLFPPASLRAQTALDPLANPVFSSPAVTSSPYEAGQVPSTPPAARYGQSSGNARAQSRYDAATDSDANTRRINEADRADAARRAADPPDPITQFQQLVFESTGQRLPIFGASLFRNVPSTFAPVDNIPVSPEYVIGPGDQLRIQVFGQQSQQHTVTVDRTGDIAFPDVGSFHVAGVRYSQLPAFLKTQLGRFYRNFDLSINLSQLRTIQVFVVGNARHPGSYTISSLSTLVNAVFASGGPLPQGSLRDVQLQRDGQTLVHFDLYDLILHGDKTKDVVLLPGDVIFIPPVGPQVALSGSVNNPAIYEVAPGTNVTQAIALAGGRTAVAAGDQVRIERIADHARRALADVDLERYNPVLANGDIIEIGEILGRYQNAVTLRGNVSSPGRYVWKQGMRITDLIPGREALITRDYFRRRNALGVTPLGYAPGGSDSVQGRANQQTGASGGYPQGFSNQGGANPENASATGANQAASGQAALGLGGSLNHNQINPGQNRTAAAIQSNDAALEGGRSSTPNGTGGSVASALTNPSGLFPPATDVVLSAPDLDWSYAVVERLDEQTLATSLLPFNPGKLFLENDQTQNLDLKSGDIVTFFSTADLRVPTSQQTRFVRLEGEFVSSGIYSVQPGETLRHLLARSGGFTPDAYLYGSEFTRQSTRRVQQQRLNEFTDSVEAQIATSSAANSQRAVSALDAAANDAATLQASQAVARLRRIQPNGRIVLAVKPDSRGIDAVPDLPLEDGDRFIVPRVPSTVAVEGQVYSANAFVFTRGRRERDYLKQAGGPDRNADKGRTFILRADGSVFSRQYGDVDKAHIFPGDTVVVPPQFSKTALLRNLIDISQIIGSIGLGAAAINVLK